MSGFAAPKHTDGADRDYRGGVRHLWRRRRVDLGKYEHPPVSPLAPIERVVEEGVMISASAVRMAVKNQLIVAALREHRAYDATAVAGGAQEQLRLLAGENDETADRLEQTHRGPASLEGDPDENDRIRDEEHRRRPDVHRRLAAALREFAADPVAVAGLVDQARLDASAEIGREVVVRLHAGDFGADPHYEADRAERLRDLVEIDLAAVAKRTAEE